MKRPNPTERQWTLPLFISQPYACGYLAEQQAISLFADPQIPLSPTTYSELTRYGFRRSGRTFYRPHCLNCSACIPIRVPTHAFRPNRSQRRNLLRNQDIVFNATVPGLSTERFELYQQYVADRHPNGGMDQPTPEDFQNFLVCDGVESVFFEFRLGQRLVAIAVADILTDGLSAVYTFYDTTLLQRGLGVFAVLALLNEAKARELPWVYLGYWIAASDKMRYKNQFKPQQILIDGRWCDPSRLNPTHPSS